MSSTTILGRPTKLDNTATKFFPISSKNNPKREVPYYHREYSNDVPSTQNKTNDVPSTQNKTIDTAKRVFIAALPFISLYKPAGTIISITLDGLRSITNITNLVKNIQNKKFLEAGFSFIATAVSISSIVIVIFYHPAGMLIITSYDTVLNSIHLIQAIKDGNKEKIIKNIIQLANNALYGISIFFGFSLELQIASLSMQVIYQLFSSINEGRKGNYIELIGHIGMLAIRGGQLYSQSMMLKRKWDIEKQIKNMFVGKLHEKWQFPSDHLPIGVEVDGVEIISWNVLNNEYINWIYEDSQGINRSMITDLDIAINENGFTKRDDLIVTMINQMIKQSEKRGVIALQECSDPFLTELEKSLLPSNWGIVRSSNESQHNQNVVLYNKGKLSYNETSSMISSDAYPCQKGRSLMNISFERDGKRDLRIFNTHVPGNPNLPGRYEFAEYIKRHNRQEEISIALGDMNFQRDEMTNAMRKSDLSDFLIHSPHHTNVDPDTHSSKCIDHMIVFGEDVESTQIDSENMGIDLQPTVDLLLGQ